MTGSDVVQKERRERAKERKEWDGDEKKTEDQEGGLVVMGKLVGA